MNAAIGRKRQDCAYRALSPMSALVSGLALSMSVGAARGAEPAKALPPPTPPSSIKVVDDGIPDPIAADPGDAARGRTLVLARDPANCLLCHSIPDAAVRFAGDLGPPLAGVGARLTIPQLRLRVADIIRLNPATIMPSYYRVDGFSLVATAFRGKPILTAAETEDVVAYLATLK